MNETVYDFRPQDDFKHDVFANEEIPDAVTVIQQFETPIFSLGDVSTITGMAKSRKTFLNYLYCSGFFKRYRLFRNEQRPILKASVIN